MLLGSFSIAPARAISALAGGTASESSSRRMRGAPIKGRLRARRPCAVALLARRASGPWVAARPRPLFPPTGGPRAGATRRGLRGVPGAPAVDLRGACGTGTAGAAAAVGAGTEVLQRRLHGGWAGG